MKQLVADAHRVFEHPLLRVVSKDLVKLITAWAGGTVSRQGTGGCACGGWGGGRGAQARRSPGAAQRQTNNPRHAIGDLPTTVTHGGCRGHRRHGNRVGHFVHDWRRHCSTQHTRTAPGQGWAIQGGNNGQTRQQGAERGEGGGQEPVAQPMCQQRILDSGRKGCGKRGHTLGHLGLVLLQLKERGHVARLPGLARLPHLAPREHRGGGADGWSRQR